jgi:glucokinase
VNTAIAAGFDVGGTNIRAEVVGAAVAPGSVVQRCRRPDSPVEIVDAICAMASAVELELAAPVDAVGVGCAGLVDTSGTVATSPNIPGIGDLPLRRLLSERLGRPVAVDNDATAALRVEMELGAAAGASDVLLVTFGTGIGAALAMDGEIRRGAGSLAGEAGHMIVAPDGPECPCGRRGCWERVASGAALGRAARAAARSGTAPALLARVDGRLEDLRGEHVGELATSLDPVARRLMREFADWVALGLNNLILLLSPELVVLGGGLSGLGEVFLDPVRDALESVYLERRRRPAVELRPAGKGDRAGALGAALLALDLLDGADLRSPASRAR